MNNFTKIALVTLFVTNFTLFLGWVPVGVIIPQMLFLVVALVMQPKAFATKTLLLYYLFFAYKFFSGLFYGNPEDTTSLVAHFLGMGIPLIISTVFFTPKFIKDCKGVSLFALIISFVTVLLSIRVLLNDGSALRVTSMANSTGDWAALYYYWRQGMANYDTAAMMLFMPVVLIYLYRVSHKNNIRLLLLAGIFAIIAFMYLGQVTTTFVLCLMVTVLSCVNSHNKVVTIIGVGFVALIIITQFTGLMDFAISQTSGSDMSNRFSDVSAVVRGDDIDENSDANVRWLLLGQTINTFISNPIFGNSVVEIGGHNYFLDLLAKYGILGCLPFFFLVRNQYKMITSYLSEEAKRYYRIILIAFIILGIIKNMSGAEYWNYLFIYYPMILLWIDSKQRKKNYQM